MVQGVDMIQIDVAFISYNPSRMVDSPYVKLDSTCTVGAYELKKHRDLKRRQKTQMSNAAYKHYKWYNNALMTELTSTDREPACKLHLLHWHIESSNSTIFKINDAFYNAVSLIIGPAVEHWYCAHTAGNLETISGTRPRPTTSVTPAEELFAIEIRPFFGIDPAAPPPVCPPDFCANNCARCKQPTNKACRCSVAAFTAIPEEEAEENYDLRF